MNVTENQKPDEVTRMYVALPTRLANNIKSLAVREHRSLTGQVVRLLERGMEAEGQRCLAAELGAAYQADFIDGE